MATKRYGPVRGAGTVIIEKPGDKQIIPSSFGTTAMTGIMEKGPTDKLIMAVSKSDLIRQTGSRIPESDLPIAAQQFFDLSGGAGVMPMVRVTDGTEVKAELTLSTREADGVGVGHWRDSVKFTALSGGRWAGAWVRYVDDMATPGAGLLETTLTTTMTLLKDELAGGDLTFAELPSNTFKIVGNTGGINSVITVSSDAEMATLYAASIPGTGLQFTAFKNNNNIRGQNRNMAILVKDGALDNVALWGVEGYWNGVVVNDYENLSMDPDSEYYLEDVVNNDTGNYEFEVSDELVAGIALTADVRPVNSFGKIQTGNLAATVLTLDYLQNYNDAGNTDVYTIGTITEGASLQSDFLTIECVGIGAGTEEFEVTSANLSMPITNITGDLAVGIQFPQAPAATISPYSITFKITGAAGATMGDKVYIDIRTMDNSAALVGTKLYYDYGTDPLAFVRITEATATTVSVAPGTDLTALTAEGKYYRLENPQTMVGGYDGHADVDADDYEVAYDQFTSFYNDTANQRLGLIKYATPGVTTTSVQKAGRDYAAAKNGMYRLEIPSSTVTEITAISYVKNTIGLNDYQEVIYPSYAYIENPDGDGLVLVPNSGMVMGVEAAFARTYEGYHKAAAGLDAVLSPIVKIPTGEAVIDDELTNPAGLQSIVKKEGNWVIWGDRIPCTSAGELWKHKREQLSHYERVLEENFDFVIFAINDESERLRLLSSLQAYFLMEWQPKRAIRGKTFTEAAEIKIDAENNSELVMAAGDMVAEITLRLADTIERLKITIGQAGIFETL